MMAPYCAWCKGQLPADSGEPAAETVRGMCGACREFFFPRKGPPAFRKYLDRLAVPVLLIDDNGRVIIANRRACSLLVKKQVDVEGASCGAALDCLNTNLPGGCGGTEFCRECTIRQALADTYVTGQCHVNIPASLDAEAGKGEHRRFIISTWKVGEVVLMKMDKIQ